MEIRKRRRGWLFNLASGGGQIYAKETGCLLRRIREGWPIKGMAASGRCTRQQHATTEAASRGIHGEVLVTQEEGSQLSERAEILCESRVRYASSPEGPAFEYCWERSGGAPVAGQCRRCASMLAARRCMQAGWARCPIRVIASAYRPGRVFRLANCTDRPRLLRSSTRRRSRPACPWPGRTRQRQPGWAGR
jgi:hypothetical protein